MTLLLLFGSGLQSPIPVYNLATIGGSPVLRTTGGKPSISTTGGTPQIQTKGPTG